MPPLSPNPRVVRFGLFEADFKSGELRKNGLRIKVQDQPFQVLAMLLEKPGEIVTREDLQSRLWPGDTFVDFDHSLNSAVRKLREALGDQPENPRFIETLHRRGYRFIAPVMASRDDQLGAPGAPGEVQETVDSSFRRSERGPKTLSRATILTGVVALAAIGVVVTWFWSSPPLLVQSYTKLTSDGADKIGVLSFGSIQAPIVTDGSRLYFTEEQPNAGNGISQVSVSGGETAIIPTPFRNAAIVGVSPSGSDLLYYTWVANELQTPLWVMPALGGSPRRIGETTTDATWSADGHIVFTQGHDLYVADGDGNHPHKLTSIAGFPVWPRCSPDGTVFRFTEYDARKDSSSLWEILADGTQLHPLLPAWSNYGTECCGSWTPDGKHFVFQSTRNGRTDLWVIREKLRWWGKSSKEPVQLTAGPMSLTKPLPSKDGRRLFALGTELRGELVGYDAKSGQFVPYLNAISANGVVFTRDGEWVAYLTYPGGLLFRSRSDGSQRLQLTFAPMEVIAPRWSPDGKQIVFMGRMPGLGWKLYLANSEGGGSPQELVQTPETQGAADWSPDGSTLVFGGFPEEVSGDASVTSLSLLDLKTHQTSAVPGSVGLYCPRWSPDGRYISATTADGKKLMLFDTSSRKWVDPADLQEGCPAWSRDGKYLYFQSFDVKEPAFFRLRISDRRRERVTGINFRRVVPGSWFWWNGLAPDDSPLVLRDESVEEIYALDWALP